MLIQKIKYNTQNEQGEIVYDHKNTKGASAEINSKYPASGSFTKQYSKVSQYTECFFIFVTPSNCSVESINITYKNNNIQSVNINAGHSLEYSVMELKDGGLLTEETQKKIQKHCQLRLSKLTINDLPKGFYKDLEELINLSKEFIEESIKNEEKENSLLDKIIKFTEGSVSGECENQHNNEIVKSELEENK